MRETAKKTDRRMLRTQRALREALTQLLRRKDYDDITIQEILDEADVGRSTFYSHCSGKDELLRLSLRMLRADLVEIQRAARRITPTRTEQPFAFCLHLLLHISDHRDLYPSLAHGRGRDLVFSEIRRLVSELARADMLSFPQSGNIPEEVRLQFIVGTFMALITWWIERKAKLAPAALNEIFQQLVRHGIGGSAIIGHPLARPAEMNLAGRLEAFATRR
jgi:AcrR family transcriptional regulator